MAPSVKNFSILQLLWTQAHTFVEDHHVDSIPNVPGPLAMRFLLCVYDVMPIYLNQFDAKHLEPYGSVLIRHSLGRRFMPFVDPTLPLYDSWTVLLPLSMPHGLNQCLPWSIEHISYTHLRIHPPISSNVGNNGPSSSTWDSPSAVRLPDEHPFPIGVTPYGPFSSISHRRQVPLRPISYHLAIQLEVVYLQRAAKVSQEIDMFNALDIAHGTIDRFVPLDVLEDVYRGFVERDFALKLVDTSLEPENSLDDEVHNIPDYILVNFPVILKHYANRGRLLLPVSTQHNPPETPPGSPAPQASIPAPEDPPLVGETSAHISATEEMKVFDEVM